MIPSSRSKLSDLYALSQSKLLGNHTLHSGTYQYSPYMAVPPSPSSLRHDFRLSATVMYSLVWLESEGENPAICSSTGRRVRLEERIHRTWKVLIGMRSTQQAACVITDVVLLKCSLYDRICLRIDVFKINCCLNILFIIWFLYVYYSKTFVLQNTDPTQREGIWKYPSLEDKIRIPARPCNIRYILICCNI